MFALSLTGDAYPQQRDWRDKTWLERAWRRFGWLLLQRPKVSVIAQKRFVKQIFDWQQRWQGLDDDALDDELRRVRLLLRRDGLQGLPLIQAFALVCICAQRSLGMQPYAVQLRAAYVITQGFLIEMATGEGKTLTASLAAAVIAFSGRQIQVVTVNDYLASRDCDIITPLLNRLGLSSGVVTEDMEPEQRVSEYRHSVVYCTGKTLVFDYLRDRMSMRERLTPETLALDQLFRSANALLLKGLQAVIVDEADSILIDEARTPLVISRQTTSLDEEIYLRQSMQLARQLEMHVHVVAQESSGSYALTQAGRDLLVQLSAGLGGLWQGAMRSEEAVLQAITALHTFDRDVHYIVRDDKVMIVDENTGRVMADRSWERGLHQLIEIKEGVAVSPPKETMARLSFQLFFRRFLRLSGMSGTCRELASELSSVYGVGVIPIPPRLPLQRKKRAVHFKLKRSERDRLAVDIIVACQQRGQPVLVGTRSVNASEVLSKLLTQAGVDHRVLNAKQDANEAAVIEQAGLRGHVTIATNMAGRGTDIKLGDGVAELGGLHVVIVERNDNARIDRQLIGRAARQGEPGSWEVVLSFDDDILKDFLLPITGFLQSMTEIMPHNRLWQGVLIGYYRLAQRRRERMHRRMRDALQKSDGQMRRALSFTGQME
jgi:preprotein translocase subunit SecA